MDLKQIRQLIRQGHSVVLIEEGQPPLVVSELAAPVQAQDVPIASRWPKGRSIREGGNGQPSRQEQVLERLNKEILALQGELAGDEGAGTVNS